MKEQFREMLAEVERKYDTLMKSIPFKCATVPTAFSGQPGVYMFLENGLPLYIGRTNDLRQRLISHRHRSHYTATFAFLLARHETGIRKASYQSSGSRADLLKTNPDFCAAFDKGRERIAGMDVKAIEERDPVRQALLEMYAAFVSGAKYNDFQNH